MWQVLGKEPDISLHIEGLYQYQLTDNISITPGIIWLTAPDHHSNNSGAVIGTQENHLYILRHYYLWGWGNVLLPILYLQFSIRAS